MCICFKVSLEVFSVESSRALWKGLHVHTVCLGCVHGAALGTHQLVTMGAFGRKEGVGVFFAMCTYYVAF